MSYPDDYQNKAAELFNGTKDGPDAPIVGLVAADVQRELKRLFPNIEPPPQDTIRFWARQKPQGPKAPKKPIQQFFRTYPPEPVAQAIETYLIGQRLRAQYAPEPPKYFAHRNTPKPTAYQKAIITDIGRIDPGVCEINHQFEAAIEKGDREHADEICDQLATALEKYTLRL